MDERELFLASVALPTYARDDFVSQAIDDSQVKGRVRRLLAVHERAGSAEPVPLAPITSDRIGRYRLVRQLGSGGMGVVYLAEQDEPFRRRVALKVIRSGMASPGILARFDLERQAMALMSHPAIARILDAGATPSGNPYFVMEYVPGQRIDRFCDAHRLSVDQRLELFLQVCDGVQHAHQRGVIHRDLKPSNILVTMEGDRPFARIIDFGVAKAVQPLDRSEAPVEQTLPGEAAPAPGVSTNSSSAATAAGVLVGTPQFMSPEQASFSSSHVDTRTDVYALGMVLYQLLVDDLPFDRGLSSTEVLGAVRFGTLTPPSERLRSNSLDRAREIANRRRTHPRRLAARLHLDLDWIVHKALARDREDRYAAASELAGDVRRYCASRPVAARPRTAAYSAWKLVSRHPIAAAALVTAGLTGVAFGISRWSSQREVRRALDEAVLESTRAALAAESVIDLFEGSYGATEADSTWTDRLIERGMAELELLEGRPEARASLLELMGGAHVSVGRHTEGTELLEEALVEQIRLYGPDHLFVAETKLALADGLKGLQELDRAEALFADVVAYCQRLSNDNHPMGPIALSGLGYVARHRGRLQEAEAFLRRAEEQQREAGDAQSELALVTTLKRLMVVFADQERWEDARAVATEALAIDRRHLGPGDHASVGENLNNLGSVALEAGDLVAADSLLSEAWYMSLRILGGETPGSVQILKNLAYVRLAQGRDDEAVAMARHVVEVREREGDGGDLLTAMGRAHLGRILVEAGRHAEAIQVLEPAVASLAQGYGEAHRMTGLARTHYGLALMELGQRERAEAHLVLARDGLTKALGPQHSWTVKAAKALAEVRAP